MNEVLKRMMRQGGYMNQADDGTGGGAGGGGTTDSAAGGAKDEPAGNNPNAGGDGKGAEAKGADQSKRPSDEEARLLKENMKKKEELRAASEALTKLQDQLKQFDGIDPEAVRKLLAEQKSAEERQLEAKGDYENLKKRMAEEHAKETKTLKEQIEALKNDVSKASGTINELSIGTQFGQSKFISEEMTMTPTKARLVYADHFDLEDGKIVGYDKPRGSANRTPLVDQYGNSVGFDEAMRKIVEADPEKDYLLKSKVKSGAGSESRKQTSEVSSKQSTEVDSVSKISSGLKGLNIPKQ